MNDDAVWSEWAAVLTERFAKEQWASLKVRIGDFQLEVNAGGGPVEHRGSLPQTEAAAAGSTTTPEEREERPAPPPITEPGGSSSTEGVLIRAQTPGVFWRSPQPGAPPFVEVGQEIQVGRTLCIIEIMKLMIEVQAKLSGVVESIFPAMANQ